MRYMLHSHVQICLFVFCYPPSFWNPGAVWIYNTLYLVHNRRVSAGWLALLILKVNSWCEFFALDFKSNSQTYWKERSRQKIKNWRPTSLLNNDTIQRCCRKMNISIIVFILHYVNDKKTIEVISLILDLTKAGNWHNIMV